MIAINLLSGCSDSKNRGYAVTEAQAGCCTIHSCEIAHRVQYEKYINAERPEVLPGIQRGGLQGIYFDHNDYVTTVVGDNSFIVTAKANGKDGVVGDIVLTVTTDGRQEWSGSLLSVIEQHTDSPKATDDDYVNRNTDQMKEHNKIRNEQLKKAGLENDALRHAADFLTASGLMPNGYSVHHELLSNGKILINVFDDSGNRVFSINQDGHKIAGYYRYERSGSSLNGDPEIQTVAIKTLLTKENRLYSGDGYSDRVQAELYNPQGRLVRKYDYTLKDGLIVQIIQGFTLGKDRILNNYGTYKLIRISSVIFKVRMLDGTYSYVYPLTGNEVVGTETLLSSDGKLVMSFTKDTFKKRASYARLDENREMHANGRGSAR